jgi:thiazole synthase
LPISGKIFKLFFILFAMIDASLIIAGKTYQSRLLVGSGKYQDLNETKLATEAAEADIITVAIRRTNIGQDNNELNLLGEIGRAPQ